MNHTWTLKIVIFIVVATSFTSYGTYAIARSPTQEERAQSLFKEFRCLVCQSQSLADSSAALADDMRGIIRERIAKNESDEAIKSYLVSRYGEAILMNPPLNEGTLLLWAGPVILLTLAAAVASRQFRRRRA